MIKIKKSGVKEGVNLKPNHYNFFSESQRVFTSKTYEEVKTKDENGVETITYKGKKGKTMVKPETVELRRKEAELRKVAA